MNLKLRREMSRILWTDEEKEMLRKLAEKNVLPQTIAKVLGRTQDAIRAQLTHIGIDVPTEKAQINYELYRELTGEVEEI